MQWYKALVIYIVLVCSLIVVRFSKSIHSDQRNIMIRLDFINNHLTELTAKLERIEQTLSVKRQMDRSRRHKDQVEKEERIPNERKIARAVLNAQKMRKESYSNVKGIHKEYISGKYTLSMKECLMETCKQFRRY